MHTQDNATTAGPSGTLQTPMEPAMTLALTANFGSVDAWRQNFVALATRVASGNVTLAFLRRDSTLLNIAKSAPSDPAVDGVPLLVFESRPPSLDVNDFIAGINWAAAYDRYREAVHSLSEPFAAAQADLDDAIVLDVRRAGVFERSATMIPGAHWRDPACVASWCAELPPDRDIIVYCVYGHEVGRATAMRLRAAGKRARFLSGGIDGWQAAGRALEPKGDSS